MHDVHGVIQHLQRRAQQGRGVHFVATLALATPAALAAEIRRMIKRQHGWSVTVANTASHANKREQCTCLPIPAAASKTFPMLATWNVCSLKGKKEEVWEYLARAKPLVLALQETHLTKDAWCPRLPGYQVLHSVAEEHQPGRVGVALAISEQCTAYEYNVLESPYLQAAKLLWTQGEQPWVVGSVYIPPAGYGSRREAWVHVQKVCERTLSQAPDRCLVIMGDWNCTPEALKRRLQRWGLPLTVLAVGGSNKSRFSPNGRWTSLDHIVVSFPAEQQLTKARVQRQWDVSDHWPVQCRRRNVRSSAQSPPRQVRHCPRLDLAKVQEHQTAITQHNYREPLLSLPEEEPAHLAKAFAKTSWKIAKELNITVESNLPSAGLRRLPQHITRQVDQRRLVYQQWQGALLQGRQEHAELL